MDDAEFDALMARYVARQTARAAPFLDPSRGIPQGYAGGKTAQEQAAVNIMDSLAVAAQKEAMLRDEALGHAREQVIASGFVPPVGWHDAQYFAVGGGRAYVFTKGGWRRADILTEAADANQFVRAGDVAVNHPASS